MSPILLMGALNIDCQTVEVLLKVGCRRCGFVVIVLIQFVHSMVKDLCCHALKCCISLVLPG